MRISNLTELQELEARIRQKIKQHDLDDFLGTLLLSRSNLQPFVVAGLTLFAVRFALPPIRRYGSVRSIPADQFNLIADWVAQYLLADPSSFHPPVTGNYHGSNLIPIILRHVGNQLPFAQTFWGQCGRSIYLFKEIPNSIKGKGNAFDLDTAFTKHYGVTLDDFISVGYVAFSAANADRSKGRVGFSGGYFQKARDQGMLLPDDEAISLVMDKLAANQWRMTELYEEYKQKDRNYASYDYNPLFIHPIVRPWIKSASTTMDDDRFMAPLPELILTRLSSGIYEELAYKCKSDFQKYFGHVFEEYVGEVLRHCVAPSTIISEDEIRRAYSDKRGKTPDWVVIEKSTAILVECKAVGYQRKAVAMGDETTIDQTIDKIAEGLVQMHEFKDACLGKKPGLERLHHCTEYKLLLLTYEPIFLSNSIPLRKVLEQKVDDKLTVKGLRTSPGVTWSVDELEKLQPHVNAGVPIGTVIDQYNASDFNGLIDHLHAQTGRTFGDSFLAVKERDIYKHLGVPNGD